MQISAANLLIASQQLARPRAAADAQAQFASALAKENGVEHTGFEPMDFKQAAPPKPAPASPTPSTGYTASGRIGANIDIRV
jgi:hypothetical protein